MNSRIKSLKKNAESVMSNYAGPFGGSKSQFVAINKSNVDGGNIAAVQVDPGVQPIFIDISNTDHVNSLNAPLFSANEQIPIPFNGVADFLQPGVTALPGRGIIITPQGYSYSELQQIAKSEPFTISGLRFTFGDTTQLKKTWTKRYKNGMTYAQEPYFPQTVQNLFNNIANTLDDPGFFQLVDGGTTIFVLVANAVDSLTPRTVSVVFRKATQLKKQNILKSGDAAVVAYS